MTTSRQTQFLSEILGGGRISDGKLAYFRARLSNRIHELVLTEFANLEQEGKITRADLARKIGKKPEQVTRWLGAAGNWTLETFSDLLIGMGCEPTFSITRFSEQPVSSEVEQLASHPWPKPSAQGGSQAMESIASLNMPRSQGQSMPEPFPRAA